MSVGHLSVFFRNMSLQVLCPVFNQVVCLFHVELYEFFVYFYRHIIRKYLLFSRWPFVLLMVSFAAQKFLVL